MCFKYVAMKLCAYSIDPDYIPPEEQVMRDILARDDFEISFYVLCLVDPSSVPSGNRFCY